MLDVFDTRPSLSGGPLEENGEGAVDQLELGTEEE
jgi:glucan biosynthesis protein